MYEIWLMLNIVWEIALGIWPLLLGALILWLAILGAARRKVTGHWRAAIRPALVIGAVVAIVAALLMPGWTRSTLSDVSYRVDWAILLAMGVGAGTAAVAFAWPLLAWLQGRTRA